ncbi:hypothetical protein KAT63_03960 [Candidatus Parcubacteria bacterium]|nr:hypothetical protein [Candidatus Parcubacteria bacterium]
MKNGKLAKAFFIFIIVALAGQCSVPFFDSKNIKAAPVSNISDTISDSRSGISANHLIAFRTVSSIDPTDTVVIKFDDTGNAFDLSQLNPVSITDYDLSADGIDYDIVGVCVDNDDLTVSVNDIEDEITFTACAGNTIAVNSDIRIEIGTNAVFGGLGANQIRNPSAGNSYFIDIAGTFGDTGRTVIITLPSSGTSVSITIGSTSPGGGGGSGIIIPRTGNLKMTGKAYPNAFMTILKDGQAAGTQTADNSGNFEMTIKSIPSNKIYSFGIFAQDDLGLLSPTLNYNLSINANQITEINNIYIPPTIALSSNTIRRGDSLKIHGSSYPDSLIVNFISPSFKATSLNSDENGHWAYFFNSTDYAAGEYFTKAKTIFIGGEQSEYSMELSFDITKKPIIPKPPDPPVPPGECNGVDLNNDSKVDILDFSILMHYWKSKNPSNRCADINQDGIVDIYDFSIMMYYWTD